jgi:hypothetical protein
MTNNRSSFGKRIFGALACVAVSASQVLAQVPAADPASRLPDSTEIYLTARVLPQSNASRDLWRRFCEAPLGNLVSQTLNTQLHVSIERDLLSWFGGRMFAAWVRTGERSPMEVYYNYATQASRYSELQSHLEALAVAADAYRETKKQYPRTLELMHDELGNSFSDVNFHLVRTPSKNKKFPIIEIRTDYDTNNKLSLYATPPSYRLGKDGHSISGTLAAPPALGLVVGVESDSSANAEALLSKLSTAGIGFTRAGNGYAFDGLGMHWGVAAQPGWIVISDQAAAIDRFAGAAAGHSLAENPRYRFQMEHLGAAPPAAESKAEGFVDLQDVWVHTPELTASGVQNPALSVGMRSFQLPGVTLVPIESRGEVFLQLAPIFPKVAEWLKQAPTVHGTTLSALDELARQIPWQSSLVYSVNLQELSTLLDAFSQSNLVLSLGLAAGANQLSQLTGLPLSTVRFKGRGWATVYLENVDQLAYALRVALMAAPQPAGTTPVDSSREAVKDFPIAVTVGLSDPQLRSAVVARLTAKLGSDAVTRQRGDVSYRASKDDCFALATAGDQVLWANGYTERLIYPALEVNTGLQPSLADLDSYRKFRAGLPGRVVGFIHVKADSIYSFAKGAMLYLGANFRPEAVEMGHIRDGYAAATVEADGVRITSSLYASEQIPVLKLEPKKK